MRAWRAPCRGAGDLEEEVGRLSLGVYIATFVYSLLVLQAVREEGEFPEEQAFVSHAAVSVALLLALLSIGVLVRGDRSGSRALVSWECL